MSLIDLLVYLLMLFFFGVAQPLEPQPTLVPTPFTAQSASARSETTIRQAQVLDMAPVRLRVQGEHPDGCILPVQITQQQNGQEITISIYREIPGDVFCAMALQPYDAEITLEGNFTPGAYVIHINDYSMALHIAEDSASGKD